MNINFGRSFLTELELNENELYELLNELENISKEHNEQLVKLHNELKLAIENHKGYIMVETE